MPISDEHPYKKAGLTAWAEIVRINAGVVISVFDLSINPDFPVYTIACNEYGIACLEQLFHAPPHSGTYLLPANTLADYLEWRATGERPLGMEVDERLNKTKQSPSVGGTKQSPLAGGTNGRES